MGRTNKLGFINDLDKPTAEYEKLPNGKYRIYNQDRPYSICIAIHQRKGKKYYEDIEICSDWHYRSKFENWYNEQKELQPMIDTLSIEKDILVPNNRVYSPDTCIFVPDWFNLQFLERGKSRGNCPLGVSAYHKGFTSNIGDGSGGKTKKYLGYFPTAELAHIAWQQAKIIKLSEALDRLKISTLMGENYNKIEVAVLRKISAIEHQISNGEITSSLKPL